MINIKIALLGFSLLLLAWPAQAQIFMCKDASGKTISSDRPIPECSGSIREYASSGKIKRTIPPPLTAEQKQQKLADEAKLRADAEAAAEQKRQDRAILARYNSEFEIEASRKRALIQTQEQVKREKISMAEAEKQLVVANDQLKVHTLKKTKPPLSLNYKIESSETAIKEGKVAIKEREEEMVQTNIKYDETLKRFRELTGPVAQK